MPLKLNVGLSKKVGEANFGSRGASVNAELELESALVDDPAKFKDRIRQVFDMIRAAVNEELNGHSPSTNNGHGGNGHQSSPPQSSNGSSNGNGQPKQNGQAPRPATQSQIKALQAIAKKRNVDLLQLVQERFRAARPEDISIKDASSLIDEFNRKE